jgi:hypothetical protein
MDGAQQSSFTRSPKGIGELGAGLACRGPLPCPDKATTLRWRLNASHHPGQRLDRQTGLSLLFTDAIDRIDPNGFTRQKTPVRPFGIINC